MKYLASLPENKNAKFMIPTNLITYGDSLLSVEQIDEFIKYNNLITKEDKEEEIDSELQQALDISMTDVK
jgi:hypothetical protein